MSLTIIPYHMCCNEVKAEVLSYAFGTPEVSHFEVSLLD
jgi:hypothetical protein